MNSIEVKINDLDYQNRKLIFTSSHKASFESQLFQSSHKASFESQLFQRNSELKASFTINFMPNSVFPMNLSMLIDQFSNQ